MTLQTIDFYNAEDFYHSFSQYKSTSKKLFLLFTGAVVPQTGKSWCPDCTNSWPLLEEALNTIASSNEVLLLKVHLEREPYRQAEFSLRQDEEIRLTCIPTLINYESKQRLLDFECLNLKKVQQFFDL